MESRAWGADVGGGARGGGEIDPFILHNHW